MFVLFLLKTPNTEIAHISKKILTVFFTPNNNNHKLIKYKNKNNKIVKIN